MDEMDLIQEMAILRERELIKKQLASSAAVLNNNVKPPESRDCFLCEEPISPARLKALPNTPYCIECARGMERR